MGGEFPGVSIHATCHSYSSINYALGLQCVVRVHCVGAISLVLNYVIVSEEAVEFNELDQFLRRKEDYKPFEDDPPLLRAQPIGVPGAYSPLQMYPKHAPSRSPSPSPLKLKEKEKNEINSGDTLAEFGLANVSVSEDELRALIEELGLGGDEASDLVKGLAGPATEDTGDAKVSPSKTEAPSSAKVTPSKTDNDTKDDVKLKSDTKDAVKEKAKEELPSAQEPAVVKVSPPDDAAA